jgi:hypothetical protein
MKGCRAYDDSIERMLAEEIGNAERDRLLAHAQTCAACAEFVDLHYQLRDPALAQELPTDAEFAMARRSVLGRIRAQQTTGEPRALHGLLGFLTTLAGQPAYAAGLAALLVVALALGVLIGRTSGPRVLDFDSPIRVVADPMLTQISDVAASNRDLTDVENSPFVYSNVRFREMGGDDLAMSFDVTRHVEVARKKDDPLVKEVVAQALLNPSQVGTRLQAMNYAGKVLDSKVRQALIFSLLNDPTLAVRLHAMNILIKSDPDEELQMAMMAVLTSEESVQMRLLAMDYVAESGLSEERFGDVLDRIERRGDQPLLIRAAKYDPTRMGEGVDR